MLFHFPTRSRSVKTFEWGLSASPQSGKLNNANNLKLFPLYVRDDKRINFRMA